MKASFSACGSNAPLQSRSTSVPSSINVYPPNVSKTKGSGKRLKGGKEIAMEDMGKRRTCSEIALLSQFEHENIVQYLGTDKKQSVL
ncbi:hypothetical protein QJS04_geneDACA009305 [Acorus gramineus]|uniref:Protein kinase domain-containing protein n=1 Tax=Acorus gramineus TaxID=55184 RepID=A0AAV9A2E9_ACOGR|nr:hypothetical protein QJS04_geneDACA009305 [Acorus gramineus]